MPTSNTRCILSCDGGGIRGLITAVMLEHLEAKLKEQNPQTPLKDYFDLIAGTSTGSIIACGVAKGYTATYIREFYIKEGLVIFPKFHKVAEMWLNRVRLGFSQPVYDGKGLEEVLQRASVFGSILFKDLPPTLITSYDTYNRQSVVMVNTKFAYAHIPVWEACRASAAAPTAFPAHLMSEPNFIAALEQKGCAIPLNARGQKAIPLIDGGIFANNPALCAVIDRLRWNDKPAGSDLTVASFGTGQNVKEIGLDAAREWGALEWLSPRKGIPLLDTLFDGSSDVVDHAIQGLLPECNYFRFQPTLEADLPPFQAGTNNLSRMIEAGDRYLNQPHVEQKLNQLAALLLSHQSAQAAVPLTAAVLQD
ncbi:MAG: patatin-like phospholipase family protein [Cyanobacteria bacterium CRU_2_1]|nr:patatin-like phospholipase family protein [Cyanobacteria bacterium RU_5_0]NJR57455.1 patatin-like phospholipase family protein [Cyanobacteria bacterium CRU_2_1]